VPAVIDVTVLLPTGEEDKVRPPPGFEIVFAFG
jgi:hypothetical protein